MISGRTAAQVAGLAVSAVALAIVIVEVDLSATSEALLAVAPLALAGALAALTVQLAVLALRWRMLLPRRADGHPPGYRPIVEALLIGNLANVALPARLGEAARGIVVARRGGVDTARSLGTVVLERVLDIAVLAAAALVGAVVAGAPDLLVRFLTVLTIVATLGLGLLLTGLVPRLAAWARGLVAARWQRPGLTRVLDIGERLVAGVDGGHRRATLLATVVPTIISVLLDGVIFWVIALGLGLDLGWGEALLIGTAAILVTGIPSAPGNVGTFELAVVWVAAGLGIEQAPALALALLSHAVIVVPPSLGGVVALLAMTAPSRRTLLAPPPEPGGPGAPRLPGARSARTAR